MSQEKIPLRLADFDISEKTGFLPSSPPLGRLPGEYFSSWEDICARIPDLVKNKTLRAEIDCLPEREFNRDTLKSEEQWRRAYVMLTFLSQAYIWAEGEAGVIDKLPKKLAVPWCNISEHVTLKPVSTYGAVVLYNYTLRDPSGAMDGDNMVAVSNFTGTEDESWFYIVHVLVELAAAPGLKAIELAHEAMERQQHDLLAGQLQQMTKSIYSMRDTVKKMYARCDGAKFYVNIRPFLSGSNGNKAFPNGITYEGIDDNPRFYNGGSAAQTTSIPSFDSFLGAVHPGPKNDPTFMQKMREYQPKRHREFLEAIDRQPSVRDYILKSHDPELKRQYNLVIEALAKFRYTHINLIKNYVVKQSKKSENTGAVTSLECTGTGGTPLETFLDQVRESTLAMKM